MSIHVCACVCRKMQREAVVNDLHVPPERTLSTVVVDFAILTVYEYANQREVLPSVFYLLCFTILQWVVTHAHLLAQGNFDNFYVVRLLTMFFVTLDGYYNIMLYLLQRLPPFGM